MSVAKTLCVNRERFNEIEQKIATTLLSSELSGVCVGDTIQFYFFVPNGRHGWYHWLDCIVESIRGDGNITFHYLESGVGLALGNAWRRSVACLINVEAQTINDAIERQKT